MVPPGTPVVNALFRQRACIENIFRYVYLSIFTQWFNYYEVLLYVWYRACTGLPPINHMLLEHKVPQLMATASHPTPVPVTKKMPVNALNGHVTNGHVTNGHVINGIVDGQA